MAIVDIDSDINAAYLNVQKALGMRPSSASIMDTYGWILAKLGKYQEAINILRQAYTLNSTMPSIRFHIAYALHKLGRIDEAKAELSQALEHNFHGKNEALKLQLQIATD